MALSCGGIAPRRKLPLEASEVFDDPGAAALAAAAEEGNVNEVKRLVQEEGVDVNSRGEQGLTPLLRTFSRKNKDGFIELLKLGADPNLQMEDGQSVMYWAARQNGESHWLRLALEYGGNPNLQNNLNPHAHGGTPLISAIKEHNVEAVKLLIEAGANVDFVDDLGMAPIHHAGDFSYWDIVYILLEAGADFRAQNSHGVDIEERLEKAKILSPRGPSQKEAREKVIAFLEEQGIRVD